MTTLKDRCPQCFHYTCTCAADQIDALQPTPPLALEREAACGRWLLARLRAFTRRDDTGVPVWTIASFEGIGETAEEAVEWAMQKEGNARTEAGREG